MPGLVALLPVLGLIAGIAIGWYLRRINTWCPHCGGVLTCSECGRHAVRHPARQR